MNQLAANAFDETLVRTTIPVRLIDAGTAWADGLTISVTLAVQALVAQADSVQTLRSLDVSQRTAIVERSRMRAAFTPNPPTSTKLPFSYQVIPLWARTQVGHVIGRIQRARTSAWAAYPGWPLDLTTDALSDLFGLDRPVVGDGRCPVLVSHDIDTLEGLQNLVARFLDIEEAAGVRSSNYIVPCAWPLDHSLIRAVADRGHEVGIHGYDHSNFTPFADAQTRRSRIEAARPVVEQYGMIGYRAPSLCRTEALIEDLKGLYRYDSSMPTAGGLFPMPNNGCATARPFMLDDLPELPLSMPRDGSLRFLGHSPDEVLGIWKTCAETIAASGGVVVLLTHCENRFSGNPVMLDIYRRFLEYVAADGRYAFSTPAEVLGLGTGRA